MPLQSKLLDDGKSLYHFSNDLVWGCRHYAREARDAKTAYLRLLANMSCVFLAGSYLEARLNELTANVVALGGEPKAPLPFWKILHDQRRDLGFKEKWDLIASVSEGQLWDPSKEPFQSYDHIVSLRNELVHYKSEYGQLSEPSVKKIRGLLQRFKGPGFTLHGVEEETSWVTVLLTCGELSEWISKTIDEFDLKCDHFLSGTEMTEMDQAVYALRQASQNPLSKNET